jgi:hypothetical protein
MRQCRCARRIASFIDSNSSKVRCRVDELRTVQIKPDIFASPRCTSAESFFPCFDSVAALALANCNAHVAEENTNALAHTQRALHGAQSSRGKSGKITSFSCSGYTRACHRHFLFTVPSCHMEFLTLIRPSSLLFSRVLPASNVFFGNNSISQKQL